MSNSPAIRILSVDDHPLVREGIAAVISAQNDMSLVAEAATGREGIQKFLEHNPDITLMDLRLPDISGIEVLTQIRRDNPKCPSNHAYHV